MSHCRHELSAVIAFISPAFYRKSTEFLRKIVEESDSLNWRSCLVKSLSFIRPYVKCEDTVAWYMEIVFSVIEQFRITDGNIVDNAVGHFFERRSTIYCKECEKFYPPNPFDPVICSCSENHPKFTMTTYFTHPNGFQDFDLTKRLLRYGGGNLIQFNMFSVKHMMLASLVKIYLSREKGCDLLVEWKRWDAIYHSRIGSPVWARRLLLLTLAVEFVTLKLSAVGRVTVAEQERREGFAESLKLLFRTITDPLISVVEMQSFFGALFDGWDKDEKIEQLCSIFVEGFPRSVGPVQPRTLQHLSRCQIRSCLSSSKKLPHGVWELCLPEPLKNYVLLQKTEDQFYPNALLGFLKKKSHTNMLRQQMFHQSAKCYHNYVV